MVMSLYVNIIYEDDSLFVVNKSSGVEVDNVLNDKKLKNNNIISLILKNYSHIKDNEINLVHRLDKYTSGIVIIAKNQQSQRYMEGQFKSQSIHKEYHAILNGIVYDDSGSINKPIGIDKREPNRRRVLGIKSGGKNAITDYKVIKKKNNHSLVLFKPKTGRTHQLRLHSAYLGHPIIGDRIYSNNAKDYGMKGFALIAKSISFKHPKTNKLMKFSVDYNDEFLQMLKKFELTNR